jgi:hypothetical protein
MRHRRRAVIAAATMALWIAGAPAPAQAARPFVTDDARIVDADSCQLESWRRANRRGTELWALPACNFTGNLELTLGGNRIADDAGLRRGDVVLQGKTLFRVLEKNDFGAGLAAGAFWHGSDRERDGRVANVYAYVPLSISLADDLVVAHLNVGVLADRDRRRTLFTGGLGAELALGARLFAIGEIFGNDRDEPSLQVGFRFWLVPGRVQVDATWGAQRRNPESDGRWWSLGLRLLSPPLLK